MNLNLSKINTSIVGNNKNIEIFLNNINKSNESNTWMLEGPKGVGKATLVKLIASEILNIKFDYDNNPNLFHPDLVILKKDDHKKFISVDDIRNLKKLFYKTSYSEGYRIALIDSISEFNKFGHNAILKIIEEPPKDSLIFIVNHQINFIPSTIKSRCKIFRFNQLDSNEVNTVLAKMNKKTSDDELNFYTTLSNGSIGDAIYFINSNAILFHKELCNYLKDIETFDDIKTRNFISLITQNKNELSTVFFRLINTIINNVIKSKVLKKNYSTNLEEGYLIELLKKMYSMQKLLLIKDTINNNYLSFVNLNTDLHANIYSLLILMKENVQN